jgi:hypothetical protein
MLCPKCRSVIPDGQSICSKCGFSFEGLGQLEPLKLEVPKSPKPEKPPERPKPAPKPEDIHITRKEEMEPIKIVLERAPPPVQPPQVPQGPTPEQIRAQEEAYRAQQAQVRVHQEQARAHQFGEYKRKLEEIARRKSITDNERSWLDSTRRNYLISVDDHRRMEADVMASLKRDPRYYHIPDNWYFNPGTWLYVGLVKTTRWATRIITILWILVLIVMIYYEISFYLYPLAGSDRFNTFLNWLQMCCLPPGLVGMIVLLFLLYSEKKAQDTVIHL